MSLTCTVLIHTAGAFDLASFIDYTDTVYNAFGLYPLYPASTLLNAS